MDSLYKRFKTFIENNQLIDPSKKVIITWSSGKDSTVLMDLLLKYRGEVSFEMEAVNVPFPQHVYNKDETNNIIAYWGKNGIKLTVLEVDISEEQIKNAKEPCVECKNIRRKILKESFFNRFNLNEIIIVSGHTLWDLAAYLFERTTGICSDNALLSELHDNTRIIEIENKFYPKFIHASGATLIRPLSFINESELVSYIANHKLPYPSIYAPNACNYKLDRRKRIFIEYFDFARPNFQYELIKKFFEKNINYTNQEDFNSLEMETHIF